MRGAVVAAGVDARGDGLGPLEARTRDAAQQARRARLAVRSGRRDDLEARMVHVRHERQRTCRVSILVVGDDVAPGVEDERDVPRAQVGGDARGDALLVERRGRLG